MDTCFPIFSVGLTRGKGVTSITDIDMSSRNKSSNEHPNAEERAAERQDAAQEPPLGTPQALEQQARARENEKEKEDGLAASRVGDHGRE